MNVIKFVSLFLIVSFVGAIVNAEPYRDHRDNRDNRDNRSNKDTHRGFVDNRRNYERHYGYYRNPKGELVFGLLGFGIAAAIIANQQRERTIYVQQPPVYIQQPVYIEPTIVTTTINIQNSNGSMTPIRLIKNGYQWVGPRGEVYETLPSVGQLRSVYGF
jgi:hypothetical protein